MAFKGLIRAVRESDQRREMREENAPRPIPPPDDSNWLVSYADMMTLLCAFFIMLFSMAKLDQPQYERVKEAMAKEFGGKYVAPAEEFALFATQILRESGVEQYASVKTQAGALALTFDSAIFFDDASAELRPEGKPILQKLIDAVFSRQVADLKQYRIVVEGHTDGRPIVSGIYPSNWELSSARAIRVLRSFVDRGFDAKQLLAIGYADTHPAVASRMPSGEWNEAALAKNRRVVIRVLEPGLQSIPVPDTTNF